MKENKIINSTPIDSDSLPPIRGIKHEPEFFKFAQWFATPGQFRQPENQKEFADSVGVCEDTISDWKKHPQFWPLVYASLSGWIKEKIPDAIGGLYLKTQGDKCSARDIEMFLRLGGGGDYYTKEKSNKKLK